MTDFVAARERLEAECALVKGTTFLRRKAYVLAEDVEELLTEFDRRGDLLQQAERERDALRARLDLHCPDSAMTDLLAARERLEAWAAVKGVGRGPDGVPTICFPSVDDVRTLLTEFDRRGDLLQQAQRERPLRDKTRIVRQGQNQYLYDQWDIRIVHCGDLTAHGYHGFVAGGSDLRCPGTSERIAEAFVAERDAAVARAEKAEEQRRAIYRDFTEAGKAAVTAEARCGQYEQALREIAEHPEGRNSACDDDCADYLVDIARAAIAAGPGLGGEATGAQPRSEHDHELHCAYANGASAVCNCGANLAAGEETP